ncbi:deoxyribonuclease IV [Candidatus Dojkabacteria bacterium]|uniref:Probable endonuclease 4 n=1 Tax=Candidatus Dojkabacteria bacterium TaxID=2099670 RepID=A0A955RIQ3_9BACT|nr:deoxyribonuclease IV [Candidatus Dojkabacteria bacterium]
MDRLIGAHVSAAGGIYNAVKNADDFDINCFQIFASPPQRWSFKKPEEKDIQKFIADYKTSQQKAFYFHSIYLINLASEDKQKHHLAKMSLIDYLTLNNELGGNGVITHIGTATGTTYEKAIENIRFGVNYVLEKTEKCSVPLILEVTAGTGNTIGSNFTHLKDIIEGVENKDRIKVGFDSAHLYASGYDIVNDLENVLNDFDKLVGLDKVESVHLNDSKVGLNEKRDRHENIGDGTIGAAGIKNLINNDRLKHLPFILETPGSKEDPAPGKSNIEFLKKNAR